MIGGLGGSYWNAAGGVRDRGDMQPEFVEVGDGFAFFGVFGLFGVVETEVEAGCFGQRGSLGRTLGVGVASVQH